MITIVHQQHHIVLIIVINCFEKQTDGRMIKLWTLQIYIIGHAHIYAYILGKIYYEIRFLLSTYDQNII